VTLFTTGDSTCPVPRRWVLPEAEGTRIGMAVPELRHVIGAYDTLVDCDVVHDHTLAGPLLAAARTTPFPVVTTVHGPLNEDLVDLYGALGDRVPIVCISEAQHRVAPQIPVARVILHGIDASLFPVGDGSGDGDGEYCLFLGRMAPDKGAHRAIEVARKAGLRLLMAAKMREPWEIRYFTEMVEPLLGPDAVYLGEVPHEQKLELLDGASALLFPIRWNEPFGLVMLEAMATGTPVLALPGGAVREVIADGISGYVCSTLAELVEKARDADSAFNPYLVRRHVENTFSVERMVDKYAMLYREMVGVVRRERVAVPVVNPPAHGGELASEDNAASSRLADRNELEQLPAEPEEPRAIA
jgi:glycosyltransferase involved in cell wall biosynthesis